MTLTVANRIRSHVDIMCPSWDDIAEDPIAFMQETASREHAFDFYFRHCELWNAMRESIEKNDVIADHPSEKDGEKVYLRSFRGHGPVSFRSVRTSKWDDVPGIAVRFDVAYCDKWHEDDYWREEYEVFVPSDLVLNFSVGKFKVWVKKLREKKEAATKAEDEKEFERLKKKLGKK